MKCIACWSIGSAALLVLAGTTLVGFAPSTPAPAVQAVPSTGAANFEIDGVHSSTVFKIQHAGVSNFYGTFQKISGSIVWDKASPESASITASIDAASVSSANGGRDNHLKGPDFFNAKEHPAITFKSTGLKKTGEGTFDLTGDVTMLGKTKPVTAKLVVTGEKDTGKYGYRVGMDATFTIKRSDFGITYGIADGALGDEVTLMVGFAGVRAK